MDTNGTIGGSTPSKRPKLAELAISDVLNDQLPGLREAWKNSKDFEGANSSCKFSSVPFQHCELNNFISNENLLDTFIESAYSDEVTFVDKSSDLFQFKQSLDLGSVDFPGLDAMRTFFEACVFPYMQELTGLPLNGHVDLFLSDYQRTDHLLCHDDELESRRIAFILYLSRDWKKEYGGLLDLFGAVEYPLAPTTVQTSIVPAFNKFVFFDVSCRSFHQVNEVLEPGVRRLALSGWFLGDPLPRPESDICNPIYTPLGMREGTGAINSSYLDPSNQSSINAQLEADSEAMLVDFLTLDHYQKVLKELKDLKWSEKGPPNAENCLETDTTNAATLLKVFGSKEFHRLLEGLTEYDFGTPSTKVISRLSKFEHKCYQLLRHNESDEDPVQEEDEQQLIDVVYFAGDVVGWNESFGGEIIYVDGEGEQLITVTPHPNSLAIIVRTQSVSSYVRYINCNAGAQSYYCFRATYTFDNEVD